ncbi:class I SAM-dependent methyltransferase [Pantanalinema sp. GBBB05]|uniref:class I SAM-dependent methyltransferase n=1 Tax=Pantanalinema sp. GBBB05 TaxID=2604139 RepID=UPI001D30ED33|nr:class I SAM-dependent methyltransferase [Pantanalinema sp. GBBB05]
MNSAQDFTDKSYQLHAENFDAYQSGNEKEGHAKTWLDNNTVDAWRHQRMYESLDPILISDPKATWLTVGDGRYGKDANYILEKGCEVLATDISDVLLKEAKNSGYIHKYQKENAEALSFEANEFDYVLCKESYHHFPRPMVALYEMLRVARKGVVLIEPNDLYISENLTVFLYRKTKEKIKSFLGINVLRHNDYEKVGNYVFTISRREIEKVALGLNYKVIAFKGINDAYSTGVEYERFDENSFLQKKIKKQINLADLSCRFGLRDFTLLATVIFKQIPSEELITYLSDEGYEIIFLPENPYLG